MMSKNRARRDENQAVKSPFIAMHRLVFQKPFKVDYQVDNFAGRLYFRSIVAKSRFTTYNFLNIWELFCSFCINLYLIKDKTKNTGKLLHLSPLKLQGLEKWFLDKSSQEYSRGIWPGQIWGWTHREPTVPKKRLGLV